MTKPVGEAQAPAKEDQKLEPKPQPKFDPWSKEERESSKQKYCCEILVSNGTLEDVSTTQAPNDALIITYTINQNKHLDLTRGPRTKVFDMYWDKFKAGLTSIDYGNGKISPKLWGYQSTPTRKKKRK